MRALCGFIDTVWEGIRDIEAHKKQSNPLPLSLHHYLRK